MKRLIEARIVNPLLPESAALPEAATPGSAGLDLRACLAEPLTLPPGERRLIPTGLAVNLQDPGLVAMVASRSGLSLKHGLRVAQGCGIIDADYHGEIGVILANDGTDAYTIQPGERIAQLLFMPVVPVTLKRVDRFDDPSERGEGGFGHTGRS